MSRTCATTLAMRRLELTLPTPAENLALDEALLDWAEDDNPEWEFLRLWEPVQPMVVVGRSSRVAEEVNLPACQERGIPVLRRSSGGAAVVAGPGCLMYAVILSYSLRPELKDIGRAHDCVLGRIAKALRNCELSVAYAGTSDLVMERGVPPCSVRKFSGNSMRAKRTHLLYHGTLLYDFDLSLIPRYLKMPPRMPDYRAARAHGDFVMNLPIARKALVDAIRCAWPTTEKLAVWPEARVSQLIVERFSREAWNFEFR
jgi:lipoate---protein ligase